MIKLLTALACLFALFVQGAGTSPTVTGKAPKMVIVGSRTNDLGKLTCYEVRTNRFRIKNTGEAAGDILAFNPNCYCVTGSADKRHLEPQEEAEVLILLDSSLVHGVFTRSVWVETNDPATPRTLLFVRGEVLPLFNGLPESTQPFGLALGESWTNRFTLTPAETNVFLGAPTLPSRTNKLSASVSVVTNNQGKTSYDVTLVATAHEKGRHPLPLSFQVEGRPNLKPMKLVFTARVGTKELKAIPTKIMLTPTGETLTRRLHLSSTGKNLTTNDLTWTPQRKGVSVQVQPRAGTLYLMATVTLTPEAANNLLAEKNPKLNFHFPELESVSIDIIAQPKPPADQKKADKGQ